MLRQRTSYFQQRNQIKQPKTNLWRSPLSTFHVSKHTFLPNNKVVEKTEKLESQKYKFTIKRTGTCISIGMLAGGVGSMVGLGGGVITIPALAGIGIPLAKAQAASQTAILISASTAAYTYYTHGGALDLTAALIIASTSSICSWYGAKAASHMTGRNLQILFGCFLLVIALIAFLQSISPKEKNNVNDEHQKDKNPSKNSNLYRNIALGCAGLAIGTVSGTMGAGGGAMLTPTLTMGFGMELHMAIGTGLTSLLFPTAVAVSSHARMGNFHPALALPLAAGALSGAWLGARTATEMPEYQLRALLGTALLGIGLRMIVPALRAVK